MPVGTTAALLMAGGTFSAASSIGAGGAQSSGIKKQAEYNAQIYDQQGEMILQKKNIADTQFLRQSNNARGAIISKTAGKGFNMGGSPLAILIDNESNMQFDKAIQDYNFSIESNYAKSGANNTIQQGVNNSRLASYTGYSNAFSTLLNTGATMGMMNLGPSKAGKL